MRSSDIRDPYEYAWRHFVIGADQRMRTFNFYIVLSTFALGAFITALEKIRGNEWIWLIGGIFFSLISTIFIFIDIRSKSLINVAKNSLLELEQTEDWEKVHKLFLNDGERKNTIWGRIASYTVTFRTFAFIELCLGIVLVVVWISKKF